MKKLLMIVSVVLVAAGGLLFWGGRFATSMVHDQLSAQNITIGDKASLEKAGEKGAILKYAGQKVDNGDKAKVYSEYIKGHIAKIGGGKTYSEISADYQKDKTNTTLADQRMTLFMGETLRGLLLNAWGWGLVGKIVSVVAIVVLLAGVGLFAVVSMSTSAKTKKPVATKAVVKKTANKKK